MTTHEDLSKQQQLEIRRHNLDMELKIMQWQHQIEDIKDEDNIKDVYNKMHSMKVDFYKKTKNGYTMIEGHNYTVSTGSHYIFLVDNNRFIVQKNRDQFIKLVCIYIENMLGSNIYMKVTSPLYPVKENKHINIKKGMIKLTKYLDNISYG